MFNLPKTLEHCLVTRPTRIIGGTSEAVILWPYDEKNVWNGKGDNAGYDRRQEDLRRNVLSLFVARLEEACLKIVDIVSA